ncbi:MAG: hypothetical protein ACRDKB_14050 [Actinomycetota bacterium]
MKVDLRVILPNRPGALLEALDAVADAGLTVDAVCGDIRPGERWGYLHVLVDDGDATRAALEGVGFEISAAHEVEVFRIERGPGSLASAVRRYKEKGENIEVFYLTTGGDVVVGTERMRKPIVGVRMGDTKYR